MSKPLGERIFCNKINKAGNSVSVARPELTMVMMTNMPKRCNGMSEEKSSAIKPAETDNTLIRMELPVTE